MKATKWIIAGVLTIALIFQLARVLGPAGATSGKPAADSAASSKGSASLRSSDTGPGGGHPTKGEGPRPLNVVPDYTDDPDLGPPLYLTAGQELAKVNGVVISLKDLMPIPTGEVGTEYVMTTARYKFLLERAVERELTFQAAKARGVELNEAQRKALAKAAERRRNATEDKEVFDDLQDAPENASFQQRDFEALMLQATLAELSGVPSRNVGHEQVLAYYEAHRAEFEALPADPDQQRIAWRKIESEIRVRLASVVRQEHQEQFSEFIEDLKEDALITMGTE